MGCGEGIIVCNHVVEEGVEPEFVDLEPGTTIMVCKLCKEQSELEGKPTKDMFLACKECVLKRLGEDMQRRKKV